MFRSNINTNQLGKQLAKWLIVLIFVGFLFLPLGYGYIENRFAPSWGAVWLTWSDDPATTITINWKWDFEGKAYVSYWNSTFSNIIDIDATKVNHVQITGLSPSTKYGYEIGYYTELGAPRSWSGELSFRTAPRISMEFTVLVQSDTHAPGYGSFGRFIDQIKKEKFNFTIHCGDLVDRSYEEFWASFFKAESGILSTKPIMPTVGNHEIYYGNPSAFYSYFALPGNEKWYSFRYANVLFIALYVADYKHFEIPSEEILFLKTMVDQAKELGLWTIVYFHIPPLMIFPIETSLKIIRDLYRILNETKPDLVISGHVHAYSRKSLYGVTYITVGAAGGISNVAILDERYPDAYSFENGYLILRIDGNTISGYYKSLRGEIIDSFILQKS